MLNKLGKKRLRLREEHVGGSDQHIGQSIYKLAILLKDFVGSFLIL